MTDAERQTRELRRYLRNLTQSVDHFLVRLDAKMKEPSTEDRGRFIARVANDLDLQNQIAKRFGLRTRRPSDTNDRKEK